MNIKFSSFILLVCGTLQNVYSADYYWIESVKSNVFEPLRPKQPPKSIAADCGTVVTEPYGLLEKTYKRGEVEEGSSCAWTLRAPANHVVNVISVGFELLDDVSSEKHPDVYSGSLIDLYDSTDSAQQALIQFTVTAKQGAGAAFIQSISSKEEMLVKITYRDNVDYATQKIAIKYEFLKVDEMKKLLQAVNAGEP